MLCWVAVVTAVGGCGSNADVDGIDSGCTASTAGVVTAVADVPHGVLVKGSSADVTAVAAVGGSTGAATAGDPVIGPKMCEVGVTAECEMGVTAVWVSVTGTDTSPGGLACWTGAAVQAVPFVDGPDVTAVVPGVTAPTAATFTAGNAELAGTAAGVLHAAGGTLVVPCTACGWASVVVILAVFVWTATAACAAVARCMDKVVKMGVTFLRNPV